VTLKALYKAQQTKPGQALQDALARIRGLTVFDGVWLRTTETVISTIQSTQ